jgi:2,3-dihydroxy-2,3-dihydrophenylpropionate dehydrogenase
MGWLEGDVALVTGGGSGLGRALVERFLEEGARVGVLEFAPDKVARLQADLGDDVVVTQGDVTQPRDNHAAVAATVERFGRLDVFVGNAGIYDSPVDFADLTDEQVEAGFDQVLGVNVKGYILGAKAAIPQLLETRGRIVLTSSTSSMMAGGGGVFYTTSKHAVTGLVRQLAYELAPTVRVNAVAPGPMTTDLRGAPGLGMSEQVFAPTDADTAERITAMFPLKESSPRAYTGLYVALASRDNSATITGETIQAGDGLGARGHMFVTATSREPAARSQGAG